jgi:catechol 2,3-dioxygenase-like lactoylglutathione lyase family enzyme
MHRSRLAGFIIDCEGGDPEANARFWSEALGFPVNDHLPPTDEGKYVALDASAVDLSVEVQAVDHPSRVHLDIESDDVEAEVRRLETLGARRLQMVRDWWVLEAPTGHRFCVVPAGTGGVRSGGREWP